MTQETKTKTRIRVMVLALLGSGLYAINVAAQDIPFVYRVENTGADCNLPPLPSLADLPLIRPLTDPFEWSNGRGHVSDLDDWRRRRAEIKAEVEHYEIGRKPDRPKDITASYANGTLTVNVMVNDNTLTLTSRVTLPEGEGPFPAMIGIGFGPGSGSLPADIFTSRKIALIPFNFMQVMAHQQKRGQEPINTLYPDLTDMGAYSAWSWGISRLIDGLELVADDLPLDLTHLGVTGCSFAGKMALFAGALDERIALTISQESGGGGAAAWRVSETLGNVETLGRTDHGWFIEDMFQFSNAVDKLPHDHHELMAMVAPRALLVLGNPDFTWLADESGYVSCRAAHEVWKAFGIPERFGFSIAGGHGHCQLPDFQRPEVEAFVDAFLLGDPECDTDVTVHPYDYVDYQRWIEWWGTGKPTLSEPNLADMEFVWLEAELGQVGSDWDVVDDAQASNGKYVTVKAGTQSLSAAPTGSQGLLTIPFTIQEAGSFSIFARMNCPTADDDSFWVKMDNGEFQMHNGLGTSGWEWKRLTHVKLSAGDHTLTMGYREDGARLDKICISNTPYTPEGMGEEAQNRDAVSTGQRR